MKTPTAMPARTPPAYRRSLGLVELVCLGIGGTIGSGIFVVPGTAARLSGTSSLLAWLVVACSACAVAFALAALQARSRHGLGLMTLFGEAFGRPGAGLLVLLYVLASIVGIATISAGLGQYLAYFGVADVRGAELAALAAFLLLNLRGIAASGGAENLLSIVKIGAIVAIVLALVPRASTHPLAPLPPAPAAALLQTVIIVYWPFTGFEISAIPVDEAKDPRAIARALLLVMLIVCAIYVGLNVTLLGAVGADALGASQAPLADAVATRYPWAGPWVAALGIVTMLSALNAYVVGASRTLRDLGDSFAIAPIAALSTRGVPTLPLVLACGGAAALLFVSNRFDALAAATVTMTLLPYIGICWAAFRRLEGALARAVALAGGLLTGALLLAYFVV